MASSLRNPSERTESITSKYGFLLLRRNIYAAAKPLLGLILLNENQFFAEIKQQLLYGHSQVKQTVLSAALDKLMSGIDRTLTENNKESFTQNLTQFRNDIQDSMRIHDDELSSAPVLLSDTRTSADTPIVMSNLLPSASAAPAEELMTL